MKSTEFQAKPMSLDEAILQLDLLDARFYVFQNAKDRAMNIVYRRDDGNFGLIEARSLSLAPRDRGLGRPRDARAPSAPRPARPDPIALPARRHLC